MKITIPEKILVIAKSVGAAQHEDTIAHGVVDPETGNTRTLEQHVIGKVGEAAIWWHTGLKWVSLQKRGEDGKLPPDDPPDVGPFEVKTVTDLSHGLLIPARDKDKLDRPFLLCCWPGDSTVYLLGWAYGHECFWDKGQKHPCWSIYPVNPRMRSADTLEFSKGDHVIEFDGEEFRPLEGKS